MKYKLTTDAEIVEQSKKEEPLVHWRDNDGSIRSGLISNLDQGERYATIQDGVLDEKNVVSYDLILVPEEEKEECPSKKDHDVDMDDDSDPFYT